ncbi:hypothetical protein CDD81_6308 [Ophiocordyceps australis]|uniref:Translin n=1 Tax=Ophiocordyceps australis TaxID=1399860 RepID=A0A2C5Y609_9HYPO|nr:hypothetical protein CDD81_6308 [Ophiocordyceps australis]
MAGLKRDRDGNSRPVVPDASSGPFGDMFSSFCDELDQHYDRKERIIKASRDVTAHAKKIIFALQRVKQLNCEFPASTQKDVDAHMASIAQLLASIAPDLGPLNRYRYAWQLRCMEELVEALSFAHYLRHQRIISPPELQAAMPVVPGATDAPLTLSEHDYLYGLFDLFGELMRFATVRRDKVLPAGKEGEEETHRPLLRDMQQLACAFELLPPQSGKDFGQKMDVMRQSVCKVEMLGYGLVVRGSERPNGWVPDVKDQTSRPASPL